MSIPVSCPNGHKHKVKNRFAGKIGLCPICLARIHVPRQKPRRRARVANIDPPTSIRSCGNKSQPSPSRPHPLPNKLALIAVESVKYA